MSKTSPTVLLCIGGGIAAYKSAMLCSRLVQNGVQVRVAMSDAATKFIGVPTLSALSGRSVATSLFDASRPLGSHIELADGLDLMIVAPATADLLAKFAHGIADDLISTTYLQATCPVILSPAMSDSMWNKAAVKRNIETLAKDGCKMIGPESGWLSCRVRGDGRMSEPDTIAAAIFAALELPQS
ncbi:Phosphopantothenoylcysteine decarboxylase [Rubripirellula amarantea]|uniref:Phosphopantothenoylcysteine decarboxylase n=1 Tax=Rubripirellula amarantea TaxID=2527999 RepID=A0A5C5WU33_9BACT|nr:flavoprotein [Rubripirellula amarantea]TWT53621.1 Phosphopantothenoylcysteine decarboxylase [Rubripirellula amarantea]